MKKYPLTYAFEDFSMTLNLKRFLDISTMDHWQWSLDTKLHTDLTAKVFVLHILNFSFVSLATPHPVS